jgi:hypothetical protein
MLEKTTTSRRNFIHQMVLLAGGVATPRLVRDRLGRNESSTDEQICERKFDLASKESLSQRPIGDVVVAIGVSFLGTPYVAKALEQPGEEHLVVNLHGLDCVTFVENTLALSRCVKSGAYTFERYKQELQRIRYRDGMVDGYASRLHYFSDWIDDNEKKHLVKNISREIGGVAYKKELGFMSAHPSSYKQLSDTSVLEKILKMETALNAREHFYIPKEQLAAREKSIEAGDIIGITTSIEGLDIIHTGIALRANGVLKYLHAPLSNGKVQISDASLVDYLNLHQKHTGVMVARPLEPEL